MNAEREINPVEIFSGTAWQAEMVKSLLENAEINAFLKDPIIGSISPWYAAPGGAGAVKVYVSGFDSKEAKEVVDQYRKNMLENGQF
jgi:hypothetical protein